VKTFPAGIGETFEELLQKIPGGFNRSYYGIAWMENNTPFYFATAVETYDGEAAQYGYQKLPIQKGKYITVTVTGWRNKTTTIKDVFTEMMKDKRYDMSSPCIEWYKNDNEMLCMLKIK
jgi:predicted transcriptional regulator YdeE